MMKKIPAAQNSPPPPAKATFCFSFCFQSFAQLINSAIYQPSNNIFGVFLAPQSDFLPYKAL